MEEKFLQFATSGVQSLHPYQPGKPAEELKRELGLKDVVKLASNENPQGASPLALSAMQAALLELTRYPDANGFALKSALQNHYAIEPRCITLGNGSNDLLEIIGHTFISAGDEVIFSEYAFLVYQLVAQSTGAKAVVTAAKNWGHDLNAMAAAVTDKTKLVFIANPNNPTGTWVTKAELESFLDQIPSSVIVVLDEAYTEYVSEDEFPNGLELVQRYSNLIVTRTFSKAWGLAALRVGFAVACTEITDLLNRVRQPFNVNSLALAAAEAVLKDHSYLERSLEINRDGIAFYQAAFEKMGLSWISSAGNFITVDLRQDAAPIYQAMLREGVIVRPIANYGMPQHLRISIGLPEENRRCIDALKKVLSG